MLLLCYQTPACILGFREESKKPTIHREAGGETILNNPAEIVSEA